jgi:hypothetical protein
MTENMVVVVVGESRCRGTEETGRKARDSRDFNPSYDCRFLRGTVSIPQFPLLQTQLSVFVPATAAATQYEAYEKIKVLVHMNATNQLRIHGL